MIVPPHAPRRAPVVARRHSGGRLVNVMPFYKDMELICRNCGEKFIFTAGEQEFYADKGFLHEPTRCPRCRSRRDGPPTRQATSGPRGNRREGRDK